MSNQQLSEIQARLVAPKGQTNAFGKYKYRSCEDILEAVKPLLAEFNATLIISDEIVMMGDRFYVKATARVTFSREDFAQSSAFAREPLTKKGMDEAQITGATSSYARKYALNGLFAIDDTKDADTKDNREAAVVEPLELKYVTALSMAATMDELAAVWGEISSDKSVKTANYTTLKNEVKASLK